MFKVLWGIFPANFKPTIMILAKKNIRHYVHWKLSYTENKY